MDGQSVHVMGTGEKRRLRAVDQQDDYSVRIAAHPFGWRLSGGGH